MSCFERRFFRPLSRGRTSRRSCRGRGRRLARRTWRCTRGSRRSSARRADRRPRTHARAAPHKCILLLMTWNCSAWKWKLRYITFGVPTTATHASWFLVLGYQWASVVSLFHFYYYTWNFSTGVLLWNNNC